MARALRIQYPGAFYHVMCRGNERKRVFADDSDRRRFLVLLRESLETYQVSLHAYVMMVNHFHLVLETSRANLSEFMRRFNICYTAWFNYRHRRCGHLYQGRYKAVLIDADNYLLQVTRYVHLNPTRQSGFDTLDTEGRWYSAKVYEWSSLSGYLDERRATPLTTYGKVLTMVGGRKAYAGFMTDGLTEEVADPFRGMKHRLILGDEDFVGRIKTDYIKSGSRREQSAYRDLLTEVALPGKVLRLVSAVCGVETAVLAQRKTAGLPRGIAAEMLYRYCGLTETQIGILLGGIDYCAVYMLRKRLKSQMERSVQVRATYDKVIRRLDVM